MSHDPQEDSTSIPSVVQPGAPAYSLPRPLSGILIPGLKRRVGAFSDVYQGIWEHEGNKEEVCIKHLRNNVPEIDPNCPDLTPAERFERVRDSGVVSDSQDH